VDENTAHPENFFFRHNGGLGVVTHFTAMKIWPIWLENRKSLFEQVPPVAENTQKPAEMF
jgi:hypothetical protein